MTTFAELALLYRAMQADPDNFVKRCAYFEALATVQTADYNALLARFEQLQAELEQAVGT